MTAHRAGLAVAAVLAVVPAVARASRWSRWLDEVQGTAWLHYEVAALRVTDGADAVAAPRELVLAGVRLHAIASPNAVVGYHAGFDLAAGSALGAAGLAYDVAVFPVGVGLRFGRNGVLALGAGAGAVGAIAALDDAVTCPVEAIAELGGAVRVLARARVAFVAGADSRREGAPHAPFGDELDATLAVRIGHTWPSFGFPSGEGYLVGVAYRELAGARFIGLAIGYSIDAGSQAHR